MKSTPSCSQGSSTLFRTLGNNGEHGTYCCFFVKEEEREGNREEDTCMYIMTFDCNLHSTSSGHFLR